MSPKSVLPFKFAAALERAEKATPGPWETYDSLGIVSRSHDVPNKIMCVAKPFCPTSFDEEGGIFESKDAEFMAHARTDIPAFAKALESALKAINFAESIFRTRTVLGKGDHWDNDGMHKMQNAQAEIARLGAE